MFWHVTVFRAARRLGQHLGAWAVVGGASLIAAGPAACNPHAPSPEIVPRATSLRDGWVGQESSPAGVGLADEKPLATTVDGPLRDTASRTERPPGAARLARCEPYLSDLASFAEAADRFARTIYENEDAAAGDPGPRRRTYYRRLAARLRWESVSMTVMLLWRETGHFPEKIYGMAFREGDIERLLVEYRQHLKGTLGLSDREVHAAGIGRAMELLRTQYWHAALSYLRLVNCPRGLGRSMCVSVRPIGLKRRTLLCSMYEEWLGANWLNIRWDAEHRFFYPAAGKWAREDLRTEMRNLVASTD